ncbi:MAG TPA: YdjY domain-containing protein, partial [Gemmataceae bacterium]|nr:YdjY domain-containing protein [Gemmataceae bacterium]
AGSVMIPDPFDAAKKPFYAANDGDVICVSNFDSAMLDLPIESSADNGDLSYEAYTERIPPLETPVLVILEPVVKKK